MQRRCQTAAASSACSRGGRPRCSRGRRRPPPARCAPLPPWRASGSASSPGARAQGRAVVRQGLRRKLDWFICAGRAGPGHQGKLVSAALRRWWQREQEWPLQAARQASEAYNRTDPQGWKVKQGLKASRSGCGQKSPRILTPCRPCLPTCARGRRTKRDSKRGSRVHQAVKGRSERVVLGLSAGLQVAHCPRQGDHEMLRTQLAEPNLPRQAVLHISGKLSC